MRIYFEKQPNGMYDVVVGKWHTPEIPRKGVADVIIQNHDALIAERDIYDWHSYHEFAEPERKP